MQLFLSMIEKLILSMNLKTFSDCVDVFLLNLCNCIFNDSENHCYSTGNLDPESELAKFYQKYNKLFEITDVMLAII